MFDKLQAFEEPMVVLLGKMHELTGSGGHDNDDGYGTDSCA